MTDGPQDAYPKYPGETPADPPAPPPGYHPPPQQQPGYGPPPPQYYQQPQGFVPPQGYASWWSRVGASIIDGLLSTVVLLVPVVAGFVIAFIDVETDPVTDEITSGFRPAGLLLVALGFLLGLAFDLWNRVFRQARTGQSIGKKVCGISVLALSDGNPLSKGLSFGRWALQAVAQAVVGPFILLDLLWPLWDDRNQTLHDKIVSSIVVPVR